MRSIKKIGLFVLTISLLAVGGFWLSNNDEVKTPQANASPITSPSASPAPKLRTISIVSSGDILLHERLWAQAKADGTDGNWDFFPQFAPLEPVISSADLALCHLETPLAKLDVGYQGYPTFNAPPQITDAITKLGFDMCGTASNHSLDQGFSGLV
jgi:poly-gamma-glutamate synthesis protein (capsule biosynthesis protein)